MAHANHKMQRKTHDEQWGLSKPHFYCPKVETLLLNCCSLCSCTIFSQHYSRHLSDLLELANMLRKGEVGLTDTAKSLISSGNPVMIAGNFSSQN